jgi:hypothetical protein
MFSSLPCRAVLLAGVFVAGIASFEAMAAPLTLTVQPNSVTLKNAGDAAFTTVTVTPLDGFTGGVNVTCTLISEPANAQHLPACELFGGLPKAPPTFTITENSPVSAPLDIFGSYAPRPATKTAQAGGLWFFAVFSLILFCLRKFGSEKNWHSEYMSAILLIGVAGCGGMSSSHDSGTFTYEVTATTVATGTTPSFVTTTPLTVVVQ